MVMTRSRAKAEPTSPPLSPPKKKLITLHDDGPVSHPIQSLPPSRAATPPLQDQQPADFSIAAVQVLQERLARLPTPSSTSEPTQRQEEEKPKYISKDDKPLKPLPTEFVPCDKLPDGPEPVVVEIEYPLREELLPVQLLDSERTIETTLIELASSDWVIVCGALTMLRRYSVCHPREEIFPYIERALPLVLKAVRSLRSSVCKTAILTVADIYITFGDDMLPLTDVGGMEKPLTSMLAQMLMKAASNEKKFVVDEAGKTLECMVSSCSPAPIVAMLLPYVEHKNPKVRGRTCTAIALAAGKLTPASTFDFGMPKLLTVAGKLLTDNTPEAREGAKKVASIVKTAFDDSDIQSKLNVDYPVQLFSEEEEEAVPAPTKWEVWCKQNLSSSGAAAILRNVS